MTWQRRNLSSRSCTPHGDGRLQHTLQCTGQSRCDKMHTTVQGHFWHHHDLDHWFNLPRWWSWHSHWCPCAWFHKSQRRSWWFWWSKLSSEKTLIFWASSEHFPTLVWSCKLRVGLYITYIDLKLCFCSFYWCIMFRSIQLWRNTFCLMNKFIAKMRIFDAHLCTAYAPLNSGESRGQKNVRNGDMESAVCSRFLVSHESSHELVSLCFRCSSPLCGSSKQVSKLRLCLLCILLR